MCANRPTSNGLPAIVLQPSRSAERSARNKVHHDLPLDHVSVSDDSRYFGISITPLGSLIDVRTSNDREPVINDTDLAMNVHLKASLTHGKTFSIEKLTISVVKAPSRILPQFRKENTRT